MKIVVFEIENWERDAFESLNADHEIEFTRHALTAETVQQYADTDIISTFIYSRLDRDILQNFQSLSLIATRSTGTDHIDMDYCDEQHIQVCNVPNYGENTVAEHVFGLLLTISHNLTQAIDRTRRGDFSLQGLQGFDLRGKTLGVIGTGSIGECVIGIARGFGMNVLAFDVKPRKDLADRLGFHYVAMAELLSQADVITLHVPAIPQTQNLLGEEEFKQMKKGMVLINTARGSLIHTQALLQALSDGTVAAAGLDVLPEEPVMREEAELLRSVYRNHHDMETLLADHILLRLRNVIITPHSAFNTREAVQRILDTTADNIQSFLAKQPEGAIAASR
ncbi:MAG: hydroxyacid dehydrogenase [Synechococcales bacterium]|nr:hydroxyacid dehydrogenase [Synechococcales bacterium]